LAGGELDELLREKPPTTRTITPAAGAAIVGLQGLPQPELRPAVTEPRLLLHELAVKQLVASPLLGQSEEIRFGRRRIRFLRSASHRGERTANVPR
jgi:hypothetical protein